MHDMTKDESFWCEFGCEVRIYYDHIEFSDGLRIPIPRNVDTNKIHNCPNLDPHAPYDPEDKNYMFMPKDPDVYTEMADAEGGHFWDYEEVSHHYLELDMNFEAVDGLEFKNYRDDLKKLLVEKLNEIPEFFDSIALRAGEESLPACLQTNTINIYGDLGEFQPAALLGIFYEMDGNLDDAKKCFEIQTEVSTYGDALNLSAREPEPNPEKKKYWLNRIEEIDQQIRMNKQELLTKKQTGEESKKAQTSRQIQGQFSLQAVISKTYDFELDDLRTFADSKFTKNDMKTILKETPWYNHNDKTLIDKVREMQAKEENDTILPLDPTDWDYLDLFDKIQILQSHINGNIRNYLHTIRRHRNITSHPKRYKKKDLEQRNKMIILYIQECKDYFKKSKDA